MLKNKKLGESMVYYMRKQRKQSFHPDLIKLTPTQNRLFLFLIKSAGAMVSMETILKKVWGRDLDDDGLILTEITIHNLRLALFNQGSRHEIETVIRKGFGKSGYMLILEHPLKGLLENLDELTYYNP